MKEEFSREHLLFDEALKKERQHFQDEMKRLKKELQEQHQAELSVLKAEFEKEMTKETTDLRNTLMEEKDKLKSLQTALENDDSKKCLPILLFCRLSFVHFMRCYDLEM